jgi:hypothetical protein
MALSETKICSMACNKIGADRLENFDTDETPQAIACRDHYETVRDALLRSAYWPFAAGRSDLSEDTTEPDFEYDNQFILPNDFLCLRSVYDDTVAGDSRHSRSIEGQRLLTNESSMEIRYTKKITDVSKFDPLFTSLLVLLLADALIGPLAGGDARIQDKIDKAIDKLMPKVRALNRQEARSMGRAGEGTWVDMRLTRGGRIDSRLGSA